jgi:hypothetical protein
MLSVRQISLIPFPSSETGLPRMKLKQLPRILRISRGEPLDSRDKANVQIDETQTEKILPLGALRLRIFLEYRGSLSQSQVFRGYKRMLKPRKLLY